MTVTAKALDRPSGPDLLDPGLHGRPERARALADDAPSVFWSEKWGVWFVTGYAEVFEALRDPVFSMVYNMEKREQTRDLSDEALALRREFYCGGLTHLDFSKGRSLLVMDPPEHTPYRKMLAPFFMDREVQKFRPIIGGIVDNLLQAVEGEREVEFMSAVAYPLPVHLFGDILGIPDQLRSKFIDYEAFTQSRNTKSTLASLDDYRKAAAQGPAYSAKIDEVVAAKRQCPAHDIFSVLSNGTVNGQSLSDEQVRAMVYLLNTGSQTTTTALIGNCVYYFKRHDVWDGIKADLSLLPAAIEEVLRIDPPAHYVGREMAEDFELGGQRVSKGETVLLFFNVANRDPAVFPDPDSFDITRKPNRHLSFGLGGAHFCLGAPFARLEALITITAMMERDWEFDLHGEPERANAFGLSKLLLRRR